jgi:hypothetical protein
VCAASVLRAERLRPTFGVDSVEAVVITAWEMEPANSATTWTNSSGYRYSTGGPSTLVGAVHVPQGALILSIELEACDTANASEVLTGLYRVNSEGIDLLATAQTGGPETPGCSRFTTVLASPESVDNDAYMYQLYASNTATDGSQSIGSVRVYFQRRISPAPVTPTFGDVPVSDAGYQYIEALVAAGITGGCGNGNYCPNATLTRRQMAVFLAKALGLHWFANPAP